MTDAIGMQFLKGGKTHYFLPLEEPLALETLCVVETEHGQHVARVVRLRAALPTALQASPLRRVVRVATARDQEQIKLNDQREQEAYCLCREKAAEKKLAMKLVDVTYTLDGRKAVFYFTAENRVDFRELVKELAHQLKVKIEMRQIGVRDEARRLGGVGCCGRTLCCCSFLKDFVSVSIRMAKDQNLSLNPTKVSGLCGRLMCCLAYEHDGTRARKKKGEKEAESPEAPCALAKECRAAEPASRPTASVTVTEQPPARPAQPGAPSPERRRRKRNRRHRSRTPGGAPPRPASGTQS